MADTLILKTDKEPTFFNKEAAIGFFIAPILGAIVGGMIGKSRMEKEKATGKAVSSDPSFWNKDLLLGGLIGGTVAAIATTIAVLSIPVATVATMSAGAIATMAIGFHLVPLAGALLGAYMGGKSGQVDERAEYEQARSQQAVQQQAVAQVREHEQGQGKSFVAQIEQERALAAQKLRTV